MGGGGTYPILDLPSMHTGESSGLSGLGEVVVGGAVLSPSHIYEDSDLKKKWVDFNQTVIRVIIFVTTIAIISPYMVTNTNTTSSLAQTKGRNSYLCLTRLIRYT